MASLSLPRVLQLKKNSLEAEREQFEKFQTLAVQKAINSNETPVKEKHVRSTIIGTFQDQSAATYWMVAIRQPLQDNRIVAWKFCHVTHKLLREGHPACLDDSQRHITMIENLGKLWVHLREGYGKLVNLYCRLLVSKLKFHAHNPRFPGNMQLTSDELDAIAENDVNNYFQLCVELFDYMEDILNLQETVFHSLGNARTNSMTPSGQCRLAALIPCAQDASQIYDCNVRLLFRLHAALPADTLIGHRERFRQQFKKLSIFYKQASSLQYYRNLLTLPMLPSNPPNFLLQSDFGTYVTPVVSIPEQPLDEPDAVGALIDTSDLLSQTSTPEQSEIPESRASSSPPPDLLLERDRLIEHLQNELGRMRSEASRLHQERSTMVASMREYCSKLETQLQATRSDLEEEKAKSELLLTQTPEITQKLAVVEEKAKVQDEKFQKLKGAYTQLREEHIALIRQKAEVDKSSASLRAAAAEHESAKMALQQQLHDRMKDVELLQQSASSSEEIEAYKNEMTNLRSELELARQKESQLEALKASMEALEIEQRTAATESQQKLDMMANEIKELTETIETVKQEKEEREVELNKVKNDLMSFRKSSGEEYKKALEQKEEALNQVAELREQYTQEKQKQEQIICELRTDLEKREKELENKILLLEEHSNLHQGTTTEVTGFEEKITTQQNEIVALNEQIRMLSNINEELSELKNTFSEKEKVITNLTAEIQNLKDDVAQLQDELDEKSAELEIASNELMTMTDEYGSIEIRNDQNLTMKNQELRNLNEKVDMLNSENKTILTEKGNIIDDMIKQKQEYDTQLKEVLNELNNLKDEYHAYKLGKGESTIQLLDEVANLTAEIEELKSDKGNEITALTKELQECKNDFVTKLTEKEAVFIETNEQLTDIKQQFEEKEKSCTKQIDDLIKNLEEKTDLNKELVEQNSHLEENVSTLQKELQNAKEQLDAQRGVTLSCASAAGVEMTNAALAALDRGNTLENNRSAAELSTSSLAYIVDNAGDVQSKEVSVAKSALIAAHNAAQLSSYVSELTNTSTNPELSDKLINECRSMLNTTKECLEALSNGNIDTKTAESARSAIDNVLKAAVEADGKNTGERSVDDELADMDSAIEEAAGRIEEMLAASRAGDSGVKLEVNGKILDACTTLMGAVKMLVQDARKLQHELGDPKTRQKMYRRNPQWSEGLISAAKAVVFAAKLLVSSADEAVGASGRVEGVSAAAHEVAGSTAQLVAASRSRAPPASPALAALANASRSVAAATGAVVAAVRAAAALHNEQEALDTSSLSLTATRRLEMESKVRALELEVALEAERARLAALHRRHYQLAQMEENGNITNGK